MLSSGGRELHHRAPKIPCLGRLVVGRVQASVSLDLALARIFRGSVEQEYVRIDLLQSVPRRLLKFPAQVPYGRPRRLARAISSAGGALASPTRSRFRSSSWAGGFFPPRRSRACIGVPSRADLAINARDWDRITGFEQRVHLKSSSGYTAAYSGESDRVSAATLSPFRSKVIMIPGESDRSFGTVRVVSLGMVEVTGTLGWGCRWLCAGTLL